MTPAARVATVIEIIAEMQAASDDKILRYRSAGQHLRSGLQRRRYAGSGDRAAVGDLFWKIQRSMARIGWHLASLNERPNPRNLVLAALVLIEDKVSVISQLFSPDIAHAPAPLSGSETSLIAALADRNITDPAMPDHIAFEWPKWLMDDTRAGLGDSWAHELGALLVEAHIDVRVNTLNKKS